LVTISETAQQVLQAYFLDAPACLLRVEVHREACGVSYALFLEERATEDDHVEVVRGISVCVPKTEVDHVRGAVVDYHRSAAGEGFQLIHPTAPSCC